MGTTKTDDVNLLPGSVRIDNLHVNFCDCDLTDSDIAERHLTLSRCVGI